MTGLNLETFLHLLRADVGAWATLVAIVILLGLMTWTSWGSHRVLRKCLVLSVAAHLGLVLYGSTVPIVLLAFQPEVPVEPSRERIRHIQVSPWVEASEERSAGGHSGRRVSAWDRVPDSLALADPTVARPRPEGPAPDPIARDPVTRLALPEEAPEVAPDMSADPEERLALREPEGPAPVPEAIAPGDPREVAPPVVVEEVEPGPERAPGDRAEARLLPDHAPASGLELEPGHRGPELAGPIAPAPSPEVETHPEPLPASETSAEPMVPSAVAEGTDQEVAAPEVVKGAPASSALADRDLRARPPHAEDRTPALGAEPSTRPPIVLDPTAREVVRPLADEAAPVLERPRDDSSHAGEASVRAETDPATSGVVTEVAPRRDASFPPMRLPEVDLRRPSRPDRAAPGRAEVSALRSRRPADAAGPLALARVTPSGLPELPGIQGASGGRPLIDVPEVYRSRLDPNRSARAQRAGASAASEQAVERALDWLARHQDADGRWDAATARYDDGTLVQGDDSFTVHCPPGETCFGECVYWEADTALTGLALLAYLGSGYTHTDGKYTETVGKGLDFLVVMQRRDGDLRGRSRAVGMYCHAMATLALCEAYALSGDERLRDPVERAIAFLVRARARDGMAWRYEPNASVGDTSILGWVVLALKSAKVVGIPLSTSVQRGSIAWLNQVASGPARGLASYQPGKPVTPTMTAEAWVCRQFLGVGGPGSASTEAAQYLLAHGPDHDPYNLYYWYYGTLAMYQHGGDAWQRWNAQVRDQIVRRQHVRGHMAGSWDPDDSQYGTMGGRIYCTALATLTLEVYYRFLRLYDEPNLPSPFPPPQPARRWGNPTGASR